MENMALRAGFDRLAPVYDLLARLAFGDALHRASTCLLSALPEMGEILLLGGGSGRQLAALAAHFPRARICALDLSPRMLALSKRRLRRHGPHPCPHISYYCTDIRAVEFSSPYDLVCTPFVLDCFPPRQLAAVMEKLHRHLKPGGYWYFSDFHLCTHSGLARAWSRTLVRLLYAFFRWSCALPAEHLPEFASLFARFELELAAEKRLGRGLLLARLYRKQAPHGARPTP